LLGWLTKKVESGVTSAFHILADRTLFGPLSLDFPWLTYATFLCEGRLTQDMLEERYSTAIGIYTNTPAVSPILVTSGVPADEHKAQQP